MLVQMMNCNYCVKYDCISQSICVTVTNCIKNTYKNI